MLANWQPESTQTHFILKDQVLCDVIDCESY